MAVRVGGRVDTIRGLLVDVPPALVGGGLLVALGVHEDSVVGPYGYDLRARRPRALPRPPDLYVLGTPAIAPDGRHVAYFAFPTGDSTGYAAVADVFTGRLVYRGPPTTVLETDAGVDAVAWDGPDRFEVRIDMAAATHGATQRTRGTVRPAVRAQVDTVRPPARP